MYLHTLRVERHLRQAALARLSGVAQNTISKLEQRQPVNPSFHTVAALARALEVSPEALQFGPAPDQPTPRRRKSRRKRCPRKGSSMPPSRQSQWNRRQDLKRLRDCAAAVPLILSVDEGHGPYVVSAFDGTRLIAGRHEVVYAFITGYAAGYAVGRVTP